MHPLELSEKEYANSAPPLPGFKPTPKTSEPSEDLPSPRRKPGFDKYALIKWYWRGLWVIALLMIYMVVVEFQVAGSIHALLLADGQVSANNTVTLTPVRYAGQTFCLYMTPQSVSLSTMLYATDPLHWGAPLYQYLNKTYCGVAYSKLNVEQNPGGPIPFSYNLTTGINQT